MNVRKYRLPILATLIALLASGCATINKGEHLDDNQVKIVRIDSNYARIGFVNVKRGSNETWIRGDVTKRIPMRGPIFGHLHVNVKKPGGESVFDDTVDYKRKSVKARNAQFNVSINAAIEDGSTIFIKHHYANHE